MTTYKLYTDGCYYINDNIGGYGGYIANEHGKVIADFSEVITDPLLFNAHESLGMRRGLELCLEHNITNIECYTDEKNLSRIYNINDQASLLKYISNPILKDIFTLKEKFESISFTFIPREKNAKADRYSRQAALIARNTPEYLATLEVKRLEKIETRKLLKVAALEEQAKLLAQSQEKQLDYSSKYKDKTDFIKLNKTFTDFIVVNSSYSKECLTTYYAQKDLKNNTIDVKILNERSCEDKKVVDILNEIIKALNQLTHLKEVVICSYSGLSNHLEEILKGKCEVPKKLVSTYKKYQEALNKFDKVTYHVDLSVIEATVNPVKKVKLDSPGQILLNAMKELGNADYYKGKNPEIESLVEMKLSKQEDIQEIQKRYLGEFLKLHIRNIKVPANGPSKKELIEQKIIQIKQDLTQQGVVFRI